MKFRLLKNKTKQVKDWLILLFIALIIRTFQYIKKVYNRIKQPRFVINYCYVNDIL